MQRRQCWAGGTAGVKGLRCRYRGLSQTLGWDSLQLLYSQPFLMFLGLKPHNFDLYLRCHVMFSLCVCLSSLLEDPYYSCMMSS